MADLLRGELIERNGVAETAAAGMRRGGEEAVVRRMTAVHVGMRHAAEDGELVPMITQQIQVGGGGVVAARRPLSLRRTCPTNVTSPAGGAGAVDGI